MQHHFRYWCRAAGTAAAVAAAAARGLQLTAANPALIPIRGCRGATPVAFLPELPQLSCRAAVAAAGFLLQLPCSSIIPAASAAAALLLQHGGCSSLQPTFAPLPMQGLWGCSTSSLPCCSSCACFLAAAVIQQHFSFCFRSAGAVVLLLLQHVGGSSLQPTPLPLPGRGWGKGGGGGRVGGATSCILSTTLEWRVDKVATSACTNVHLNKLHGCTRLHPTAQVPKVVTVKTNCGWHPFTCQVSTSQRPYPVFLWAIHIPTPLPSLPLGNPVVYHNLLHLVSQNCLTTRSWKRTSNCHCLSSYTCYAWSLRMSRYGVIRLLSEVSDAMHGTMLRM